MFEIFTNLTLPSKVVNVYRMLNLGDDPKGRHATMCFDSNVPNVPSIAVFANSKFIECIPVLQTMATDRFLIYHEDPITLDSCKCRIYPNVKFNS